MPRWVAERIARYPQRSLGNALRDPLPVPFTAQEVVNALVEIGRLPQSRPARVCARVDPASVHTALRVQPILESRNGGWIDLNRSRRAEPYLNRPTLPRAGVFHLGCALARLPGKPLPPVYASLCNTTQPQWLGALLNVSDIRTTFTDPPGHTGDEASYRPHVVLVSPGDPWSLDDKRLSAVGYHLERMPAVVLSRHGFSHFEIHQTYGIKEGR